MKPRRHVPLVDQHIPTERLRFLEQRASDRPQQLRRIDPVPTNERFILFEGNLFDRSRSLEARVCLGRVTRRRLDVVRLCLGAMPAHFHEEIGNVRDAERDMGHMARG